LVGFDSQQLARVETKKEGTRLGISGLSSPLATRVAAFTVVVGLVCVKI